MHSTLATLAPILRTDNEEAEGRDARAGGWRSFCNYLAPIYRS